VECREVKYLLSRCIENDIKPQEVLELEEHLKNCRKCAKEFKTLRNLVSVMGLAEGIEPPELSLEVQRILKRKTWYQKLYEFVRTPHAVRYIMNISIAVAIFFLAMYFIPRRPLELVEENIPQEQVFEKEEPVQEGIPGEAPALPEKSPPVKKTVPAKKPGATKKESEQKIEQTHGGSEDIIALMDRRIQEAREKYVMSKPFREASEAAAKIKKENGQTIDAVALRENLTPYEGGREFAEKLFILAENLTAAQLSVLNILKEMEGKIINIKKDSILFYIPMDKYPAFIERIERDAGGIIRPSPGEYKEEVEKKKDMISIDIEFISRPEK